MPTSLIATSPDWSKNDRIALLAAACGVALVASAFYTPLPLIIAFGVPFLLYFLFRPLELLMVMVFLIPFNFVFTVGNFPVAAELLKVFIWVPFLATRNERAAFAGSHYNRWFAVLAGIILRALDLPFTVKECERLASNVGLVYICINLVDSREKALQILQVLTFSAFLVACHGFYQWAIQDFGALFWIVNPRLNTSLRRTA